MKPTTALGKAEVQESVPRRLNDKQRNIARALPRGWLRLKLDVLKSLWESNRPLPITHLGQRTGIPNRRLHEFVKLLIKEGMVESASVGEYLIDRRAPEYLYKLTAKGASEYPEWERWYTIMNPRVTATSEGRTAIPIRD